MYLCILYGIVNIETYSHNKGEYFVYTCHILSYIVKVQVGWLVYSPMLIPRQLRFSLYSEAVITGGLT